RQVSAPSDSSNAYGGCEICQCQSNFQKSLPPQAGNTTTVAALLQASVAKQATAFVVPSLSPPASRMRKFMPNSRLLVGIVGSHGIVAIAPMETIGLTIAVTATLPPTLISLKKSFASMAFGAVLRTTPIFPTQKLTGAYTAISVRSAGNTPKTVASTGARCPPPR